MKAQTRWLRCIASLAGLLLVLASAVLAGPPLICHSIDIGKAQSLPWSSSGWNLSGQESYDVGRLVVDTNALLRPETPVLVRMETMRRATLYAQTRDGLAAELLTSLQARATQNPNDALAAFDYGYLVETYKQASWLLQHTDWVKTPKARSAEMSAANKIDGNALVEKAITLRQEDPEMEFAAALMTKEGAEAARQSHLRNAMAGAKGDALLARNLASRFPKSAA